MVSNKSIKKVILLGKLEMDTFFQNYTAPQKFSVRDILWSDKIYSDSCVWSSWFVHTSLSP